MVQKVCILVHFCSKHVHFCKKNAKKRKKTLIFTPIFSPKTHKSYKITLFTTTNHPIFQNFPKNPLFFDFFYPFSFCLMHLCSYVLCTFYIQHSLFDIRNSHVFYAFVLLSLASLQWLALNLPFWLFKFVSDFDIRISSAYSFTHLYIHSSIHSLIHSSIHFLIPFDKISLAKIADKW